MCGVSVLTLCVELVSSSILWSICVFVMVALVHAGKMKVLCYVVLLVGAILCSGEAGEITL